METYAIDFETYYDKDISLKNMSPEEYLRHPDVDIYLVSIVGTDGYKFSGAPMDADWEHISNGRWAMHNARFDLAVFRYLREMGTITAEESDNVVCTADMCAYLTGVRDLQGACQVLLNKKPDKSYRVVAKGKHGWDFTSEEWAHITAAGISDAESCLELWQKCSDRWPEFEQKLSRITRDGCMRGVCVDMKTLKGYIETCDKEKHRYESMMPWIEQWYNSKLKTPTTKSFLQRQCDAEGIEMPKSMDKKGNEYSEWCDKYEDEHTWIRAVRVWNELHRLRGILQNELDMCGEDGIMKFSLLYCGSSTGRWSGGSGGEE